MAIVLEGRAPARGGKSESLDTLIRDLEELCSRGRDGDRLPTRAQLMESYSASERTVLRALDALERSHKIVRKQGWGVFISRSAGTKGPSTEPPLEGSLQFPAGVRLPAPLRTGTVGMTAFLDESTMGTDRDLPATLATLRAIESESLGLGLKSTFLNRWRPGGPELSPAHCVRQLLSQGVDSVIVVDLYTHPYVLGELTGMRDLAELPVVYVSNVDHYVPCAHVSFDNRDSGYRAAEMLQAAGHGSVTFLSPYQGRWVDQRVEGASIACRRAGLVTPFRLYPSQGQVSVHEGVARERVAAVVREMIEGAGVVGGIVAAHDRVALHLMDEAGRRGLVAGRDYGLVGFDDDPRSFTSGLSTMRPPFEAMGSEAVRVAASCLAEGTWNRVVSLRAEVVARNTHRCPHASEANTDAGIQSSGNWGGS